MRLKVERGRVVLLRGMPDKSPTTINSTTKRRVKTQGGRERPGAARSSSTAGGRCRGAVGRAGKVAEYDKRNDGARSRDAGWSGTARRGADNVIVGLAQLGHN